MFSVYLGKTGAKENALGNQNAWFNTEDAATYQKYAPNKSYRLASSSVPLGNQTWFLIQFLNSIVLWLFLRFLPLYWWNHWFCIAVILYVNTLYFNSFNIQEIFDHILFQLKKKQNLVSILTQFNHLFEKLIHFCFYV